LSRLTRAGLRRVAIPALLVATLVLAAAIAGYFSVGSADKPPVAGQMPQSPFVRGVIQDVASGHLTLSTENGPVELRLASNAPVEALRPISVDRLTVGDWLNGGAIGHAQTLFALVGLIVIPPAQLESPR
jgi:hypothetical protein